MDFLRFFRRKNPYAEFDELAGVDIVDDPIAFLRWRRAAKDAVRRFFDFFRRKQHIGIRKQRIAIKAPSRDFAPSRDIIIIESPRTMIEFMRRAGIKSAEEESAERRLRWWNSLSPEQRMKVHPGYRVGGIPSERGSREEILRWWYGLSPGEQARVAPNSRPAPIGRDPRQLSNPTDAGNGRHAS